MWEFDISTHLAAAHIRDCALIVQAMQEVGKLRTELDRQTVCAAEATQAQRCLEDALSKAQAAAEMAEARYQTKCQELSKTKLAKPSGIGESPVDKGSSRN